jgi:uncharacterized membrane protein
MNFRIFKVVLAGLLLGTALYFMPFFVLKVAVFMSVLFLFFGLFRGRHRRHHYFRWAMADRIRNMNEEEYADFQSKWMHEGCRGPHNQGKGEDVK